MPDLPSDVKPWERQANESRQAYEAFSAYRDMEEGRSILAAYRAITGNTEETSRANGTWTKWSARFRWIDRAKAYDEFQDKLRSRTATKEIVSDARKWIRRREEHLEAMHVLWSQLLRQSQTLALMPIVARTVTESVDGKAITTVYQAVAPDTLRQAAQIAEKADQGMMRAVAEALRLETAENAPQMPVGASGAGETGGATRRLDAWRAAQRRALIVGHAEAEPDPWHGETNGNGNGHLP